MNHASRLQHLLDVPAEARRLYPRSQLTGLEPSAMQVLIAVVAGEADDTTGLTARLAFERSTVSHSVRELAERGLITRTVDGDDRRRTRLAATAAGAQLVRDFVSRTA